MLAIAVHLVLDSYFAGKGFPPVSYVSAAAALGAKVSLNLVFVPRWGLEAAAIATSVVYIMLLIAKVVVFSNETGVSVTSVLQPRWGDVVHGGGVLREWLSRMAVGVGNT